MNEDRELATTRWSDALSSSGQTRRWGGVRFGTRLVDSRTLKSPASPPNAFVPIQHIGGRRGWYYGDGLWKLRGLLDLLEGGVGLRRGRRDQAQLRVGDIIDCWRVESFEPDRRLVLFAEMKLPGRAWLEFEVEPTSTGSQVRQTAIFDPVGLGGLAYWYLIFPLHQFVFAGMLRGIIEAGKGSMAQTKSEAIISRRTNRGLDCLPHDLLRSSSAGGFITATSVGNWYQTLAKPSWNPPDQVFAPVWTVLYILMGISGWLVWRRSGLRASSTSFALFGLQLSLNVGWSALFFGLHSPASRSLRSSFFGLQSLPRPSVFGEYRRFRHSC